MEDGVSILYLLSSILDPQSYPQDLFDTIIQFKKFVD